jgi:serine/threonine-protein kinase RsbW
MTVEKFDTSFPSDTSRGQEVQERIIECMQKMQYSEKDVFGMRLALEEALVNAIKHGNGMDPNKQVHVTCRVDGQETRVTIEDEGPGFDPNDVPDPTSEENLEKPGGRGIMLMRAFMSEVTYSDTGNEVLLVKAREVEAEDNSAVAE